MSLSIQTFTVDITPPINTWLCLGFNGQCRDIETPLYLRGIIFHDGQQRYVLAAMDFALLCGASHRDVLSSIAEALSLPIEHVVVQTVHQHDVPGIDREVHEIMAAYGDHLHDATYWQHVLNDIRRACQEAEASPAQAVAYLRVGEEEVVDYASNRRLEDNGRLIWRSSKYQSADKRSLPVGNIDPYLRQTAFYNEDHELLLSLNTYASHPQVADRRELISDDAPGYALRLMSEHWPQAMHVYFTGCAANIANGKFAGPDSSKDIALFGRKLADAMLACVNNGERRSVEEAVIEKKVCNLTLQIDAMPLADLKAALAHRSSDTVYNKYMLAKLIHINERGESTYPFAVSRLSFGSVQWYFLPAEMFIEYQQYLHHKQHDKNVMVAAYGDAFLAYIPTASDFKLGGYELDFCYLTEDCEQEIHALLNAFT